MLSQTRRMEKSVVRRASSGVGCSNNKGRSWALHPDSTKIEKKVVHRASSGIGCSNNKGWSRVLHPDLTKMEKALSAGPLLVLDVPTTKDGPGRFILI
jgi:hypothetical protein